MVIEERRCSLCRAAAMEINVSLDMLDGLLRSNLIAYIYRLHRADLMYNLRLQELYKIQLNLYLPNLM
jgi:hypothetical protein